MRARIGVAETDKLIELETSDVKTLKKEVERAVTEGGVAWFTDTRGRSVGIPARNIAFVEIDDNETVKTGVGFAPMA
ncbi:MAG: DUF3107 family protein [Actinobacteria bacterium]|nr:DUF3107 family protein [Actinomycetota bacterium]MCI0544363.1 DUF3107 family protein [Actinomycetota bacterium]MCI0679569.1 DUF3107 family protein [Actinomycetota bacterium]